MYGVEWLILLGMAGLVVGAMVGYLLATRGNGGKRQLEADLAVSRQELQTYRESVVTEFSETARKFQALNDAYTDLHRQLARSSQTLCGDITGPLLEAPAGHQDVIPANVRERIQSGHSPTGDDGTAVDPYEDDAEIRVPEPGTAAADATMAAAATTGGPRPEREDGAGETTTAPPEAASGALADGEGGRAEADATKRAPAASGTQVESPAGTMAGAAATRDGAAVSEAAASGEAAAETSPAAGESPEPERKAAG